MVVLADQGPCPSAHALCDAPQFDSSHCQPPPDSPRPVLLDASRRARNRSARDYWRPIPESLGGRTRSPSSRLPSPEALGRRPRLLLSTCSDCYGVGTEVV